MKNKPLDVVLLVFKILLSLILVATLAFCCVRTVENHQFLHDSNVSGERPGGLGLSNFVLILLMLISSVVFLTLNGVCMLTSYLFKSSAKRDRHLRYFAWSFLAPFAMALCYWGFYEITYLLIV